MQSGSKKGRETVVSGEIVGKKRGWCYKTKTCMCAGWGSTTKKDVVVASVNVQMRINICFSVMCSPHGHSGIFGYIELTLRLEIGVLAHCAATCLYDDLWSSVNWQVHLYTYKEMTKKTYVWQLYWKDNLVTVTVTIVTVVGKRKKRMQVWEKGTARESTPET